MYYLTVYNKATNDVVLCESCPVLPVMPAHWPFFNATTQDYLIGADDGEISDDSWETDGSLSASACASLGITLSEKGKYRLGLVMSVEAGFNGQYYKIVPATGVVYFGSPLVSAMKAHLEVAFIPGDPSVNLTGGPYGGAIVNAEPSVEIRVAKKFSDGSAASSATDTITFVPSKGRSGIMTASLSAGTKDFTFSLPFESGNVTIVVYSGTANTDPGVLTFYRQPPLV